MPNYSKVELADFKATRKTKRLVKQVLRSGRLTYGDKTRELERRFAEIHGAKHAIFTSSGTAALKISLHALKDKHGWKDGSEVIIPSVTFVATMSAVIMNNLKPVLWDVDKGTANINPDFTPAITKKTVAIIPVHLLGQPANMKVIAALAKQYGLEVVEDSCETMFVNKLKGTTACFSTYIAHLLVTGVGGFILTNDDKLAITMRSMLFHGRDSSYLNIDDRPKEIWKRFYFPRMGYSDRMTELEAAIGLGELDGWEEMVLKRQENADYLRVRLKTIGTTHQLVTFPWEYLANHSFMFFPCYVQRRDELMVYLEKNGIQTRTMMPLISQPIAKPYLKKKYPVAQYIEEKGLLLPCHQYLKRKDLDHIINTVKAFYG